MLKFTRETAAAKGGISSFLCWGEERELATLDRAAGRSRPLAAGELAVAVLRDPGGAQIDEIMIGMPEPGFRIITTHGGSATAAAVAEFLQKVLDAEEEVNRTPACLGGNEIEEECDLLLAQCLTSTQAAMILRAREGLTEKIQRLATIPPPAKIDIIDGLLRAWPKAQALLRGRRLCLAGPRNSGKSTIFNLLLGESRALVSGHAGTTRDALEEWCDIAGYAVLLVDTAGIAADGDFISAAACAQALQQVKGADTIAVVLDASLPLAAQQEEIQPLIAWHEQSRKESAATWLVLINKIDAAIAWGRQEAAALFPRTPLIAISAHEQSALHLVRQTLAQLWGGIWQGEIAPLSARQASMLLAMRQDC